MAQLSGASIIVDGFVPSDAIDLTTDTTTVYTGKTQVRGIFINAVLSAVCAIKDGSTTKFSIGPDHPLGFHAFGDAEFLTSLVVDPDNGETTGNVTVIYNPFNNLVR